MENKLSLHLFHHFRLHHSDRESDRRFGADQICYAGQPGFLRELRHFDLRSDAVSLCDQIKTDRSFIIAGTDPAVSDPDLSGGKLFDADWPVLLSGPCMAGKIHDAGIGRAAGPSPDDGSHALCR